MLVTMQTRLLCICCETGFPRAAEHDSGHGGHDALLPTICNRHWEDFKCIDPDLRQSDQPGEASATLPCILGPGAHTHS